MSLIGDYMKKVKAGYAADQQQPFTDADAYRKALERAAYSDAGSQYGAGLNQITSYLAGAGPLADSGAGNALRAKLASSIYGGANSRIGQDYASYLGNALQSRRAFLYQLALMKQQKKLQGGGGNPLARIAGAVGGFFAGGPAGAAAGYGLGAGYPGSYQAPDTYIG